MNIKLLRQLVKTFGWVVWTLPEEYQPAAEAFLYSLTNTDLDSERSVPREILPTIALAVLSAIFEGQLPPDLSYEAAVEELNTHQEPVLVQRWNYPYFSYTILGYESHPHYYVMGGFTTYPQGGGLWLVEDRYDWYVPDYWKVPNIIADKVPVWVLSKFCERGEDGWYISEVGTLDKWSTPYWHRSIVKLSDYLDPQWFE